jgi:hypothetical protein
VSVGIIISRQRNFSPEGDMKEVFSTFCACIAIQIANPGIIIKNFMVEFLSDAFISY